MSSLSYRTIKNSIYGIMGFIWPLILAFISIPILIQALGTSHYGFFIILNTSIGFFSLLDLGFNYSFTKKLSESYENPDKDELNKLFSSTYITYAVIGLLVFFILIFGTPIIIEAFKIPQGYVGSLPQIFFFLGLTFFFKMLIVPLSQVPLSIQRSDVVTKISMLNTTAVQIVSIVLAIKGFGIFSLVLVQLISSIAVYIVYQIFTNHALPFLRVRPQFSFSVLRIVVKDGFWVTINNLVGSIVTQLDKIVLGILSGPSAVSYYSSSQMIPEKIQGTCFSVGHVFFPVFSHLEKNQAEKVSSIFRRVMKVNILIASVLTLLVFIYGHNIIYFWLGADFASKISTTILYLTMTYFLLSINIFIYFFLTATRRLKVSALFGLIIAVLDVIFMFVLIPIYKIDGAAIAYLISALPVPFFLYYVEKKYLKNSSRDIIFSYSKYIFEILVVSTVVYFISKIFFMNFSINLFMTIFFGGLSFLLFIIIYYFLGFVDEENKQLFKEITLKVVSKIN